MCNGLLFSVTTPTLILKHYMHLHSASLTLNSLISLYTADKLEGLLLFNYVNGQGTGVMMCLQNSGGLSINRLALNLPFLLHEFPSSRSTR